MYPCQFRKLNFIGVGVPDFREGQAENSDKTGKYSISRDLKGNFYDLSWNGKHTPHSTLLTQIPYLTLKLSQENSKKLFLNKF